MESERIQIKDLGERRVGHTGVEVASNHISRQPAAERFLYYEPPGSSVGDTGELTSPIREPFVSASTKPIHDVIRRWADTLLARNLAGHMSLYSARLERFNGAWNVERETVKASKQRLLSGLADVHRFEIHDVRVMPSRGGSVIAEFRVESDAAAQDIDGWYRLGIRQHGGDWKIYREERLQPLSRTRR